MSNELESLYREVILDHYKNPRGHGVIEGADVEAEGQNPLCGDEVSIFVSFDGDKIEDVKFRGRGLECHPYDCAGMLVAQKAGVILTDGFGRPLDAPMDVHSGVHWCGYANETLRKKIEPVILDWFKQRKVVPS